MIATTEKKIAIRKAPAEKAGTYDEGYVAKGTDDIDYVVVADKKGFKRWMKVKKENVAPEEPTKPKRAYKKKEEPAEEPAQVEEEPAPKPKRAYKKKAKVEEAAEIEEPKLEEEPPKPKRAYKKKVLLNSVEQGTQTDEEVVCTPTKVKKERKVPDAPRKK